MVTTAAAESRDMIDRYNCTLPRGRTLSCMTFQHRVDQRWFPSWQSPVSPGLKQTHRHIISQPSCYKPLYRLDVLSHYIRHNTLVHCSLTHLISAEWTEYTLQWLIWFYFCVSVCIWLTLLMALNANCSNIVKGMDFIFDLHVPRDSLNMTLTKFLKRGHWWSHVTT